MSLFLPNAPVAPGASDAPNQASHELPDSAALTAAIAKLLAAPPITSDGSAYNAAVPDQQRALGLMSGIAGGSTPSAAAAQQAAGLDQASARVIDPRDLAHSLLAHSLALHGVAAQASAARAGESQQGADMFNAYQPEVAGQALKEYGIQSGLGHINNQIGLKNQDLMTKLKGLISAGHLEGVNATTRYNAARDGTKLASDDQAFQNNVAELRAALAGGSAATAGLADYLNGSGGYSPRGITAPTDPNTPFLGGNYATGSTSSAPGFGTPSLTAPANPYPDLSQTFQLTPPSTMMVDNATP